MTRIAYLNIFARDVVALSQFYSGLFGFPEIVAHRSPIYRCLDAGGLELGFNAQDAYDLLNLADRYSDAKGPVRVYFTLELTSIDRVHQLAEDAVGRGGRIMKPPYTTYYNAVQAVLEDPEGNIFRLNHRIGPRIPAGEVENPPWKS